MKRGELALLCRSCGLCCDGSLFGRVDLEADEVEPARRQRLRVLPSGKSFDQPCAALVTSGPRPNDRCCSVYDERPRSCHRFTCKLYERHRSEGGPLEDRLAVVRRVRRLLATVQTSGPKLPAGDILELTRSLEEDFARAR